ncbi:MAG TPA: hypothetical protein VGE62_00150 [Candidatus Paceibacterota bacterium]
MSLIRVGVLRGGPSHEYEVSLKTGQHILSILNREPLSKHYKGVDIFIDKGGIWHIDGVPMTPELAMRRVDVVFNALKGTYGEDGTIHNLLKLFSVPYVGSEPYATAMTMNKGVAKNHFKKHGIKTPYHKELNLPHGENLEPIAHDVFKSFPMPVVVKPKGMGSSLGVSFASNFQELIEALDHARGFSNEVLVEEHITGKEIISGFLDDFRGKDLYHMFPVEVKPAKHPHLSDPVADAKSAEVTLSDLSPEEQAFAHRIEERKRQKHHGHHGIFDWSKKFSGAYDHHSPSTLTPEEKKVVEDAMGTIRKELGLSHFATADFIVHPRRGVYVLEVNALPHIHEHAPIYKSLDAAGIKHHEFIDHLIRLALKRGK